jgi:hypothetical protein
MGRADPRWRRHYEKPHRGGRLLAIGLLGFLFVPAGIYAFFQAWSDLSEMKRGAMDPTGRRQTQVAFACGGLIVAFVAFLVFGVPLVMVINELFR